MSEVPLYGEKLVRVAVHDGLDSDRIGAGRPRQHGHVVPLHGRPAFLVSEVPL